LRRREEAAVLDLRRVLGTALHGDPRNANLGRILADLNIAGWRRIAGKGEPEEARSARRILSTYRAQTGHYLPEQALGEGQPAAAALELRVATAVTPEDPLVWRGLAVAEVRSGRPAEALRALERFAALAPDQIAALAKDAEFAPLKEEAAFRRLLESPAPAEKK
jgi:Flp pilus assembly protein TadD